MDIILLALYLLGLTGLETLLYRKAPIVISTGGLVIVILMMGMAMLLPYIALKEGMLEKTALNIVVLWVGVFYLAWLFSGLLGFFVRK